MRLSSRKMAEQALYTGRYKYYRVRINPLGCKGFYETSRVKALKIGKCLRVIPGKIGAQNNNNLYRYSPILFKRVRHEDSRRSSSRFSLTETKHFYNTCFDGVDFEIS